MKESSADRASILRCTGASSMFCRPVRSALLLPSCTCSGWTRPEGGHRPSFPGGHQIAPCFPSREDWPPHHLAPRHSPGLTDRGHDPEVLQRLPFTLGDREAQRGRMIAPRSRGRPGELAAEAGTAGPGLTSPGGPAGRRFLLDTRLRRIRRKD